MSRFFPVVAFGTTMLLAPVLLFPQGGAGGTISSSSSSSMSSSGPHGLLSSSGNGSQTTFTYNYPPGQTVYALANVPYSGHTSSQNVRTLANGTHLNMQTGHQPMTYRDSLGRTRTDAAMMPAPMMAPASADFKPRLMRLPEITDPVGGFRYVLDDANRIAHRITIQARPDQEGRAALAARPPIPQTTTRALGNGATLKSERLGTQSMFGVTVTGQRNTTTYPPGTYQGNDQPLTAVSETWRSNEYRVVLLSKNSQPDGGESSSAMTDFSAAEPDPTLFMVPAGYQIVDETGQFTITVAAGAK